MQLESFNTHRGVNRLINPLNSSPEWLQDIKNGYIDKENDIQERSGIAKYNAIPIYGSPTVKYVFEAVWDSGTKDIIARAGTAWWIYNSTTKTGSATSTSANKLVDSAQTFTSRDIGRTVRNTTDVTTAYITARDSATQVTLSSDIFTSGETYVVDIGFGELDAGRTSGVQGQAVMFNNTLIMVDGGAPRKCSSAYVVAALGGTPPSAATAVHIHNYHVILNDPTTGNVVASALNNAEDYTTANDAITLSPNDVVPKNDSTIGFATYNEDILIIIGKKYVIAYNAPADVMDWNLQDYVESGGLTNMANVMHGGMLYIPGITGLNTYVTLAQNREVDTDDLTYLTSPLYKSYLDSLGSSAWTNISGVVDQLLGLMYLCFPLSGGHEILVYSFKYQQVVGRYTGITANGFLRREDGTILIASNTGQIYTMNSGTTDDGTTIDFRVTTMYYRVKENYFTCRQLNIDIEHTATFTLTTDYGWDGQAGSTLTKSIGSNALNRTTYRTSDILGRGKGLQLTFRHNTTSGVIINICKWALGLVIEGQEK